MLHPTASGPESLPTATPGPSDNNGNLEFEVQARRKDEQDWRVVARLRYEDDAKAALWAIVFTGQYSGVTVRRDGAAALIAEWPVGPSALR